MKYNKLFKLKDILHNNMKNITSDTKMRNRKLSIEDIISYRFNYSECNKTKQSIVSSLNYDNNKKVHLSSYLKKEEKIPIDFYKKTFLEIKDLFGNKNDDLLNIIAIDGTYTNTNINREKGKTQTTLNMGYYDLVNHIPIDISFNGAGTKNNEVNFAKKWIENNDIHNTIFVCDRAYFKYDYIKFLMDNKLNFIIRIKENSQLKTDIKNTNKKKDTIDYIKNNCRLIEYNIEHIKKVIDKDNNERKLQCTNKYTLITNLSKDNKEFTDDNIKNIYKNRWYIEIFFKHLKNNFNFEHVKEKKEIQYKKIIYCSLIVIYISKLIKEYSLNLISKKKDGYHKSINETNLIKGIYSKLLTNMIYNTLAEENITKFINSYIIVISNKEERHFPRSAITPFTKWYVKGYADRYKYKEIINAIDNEISENLHANIKTKIKHKKCV